MMCESWVVSFVMVSLSRFQSGTYSTTLLRLSSSCFVLFLFFCFSLFWNSLLRPPCLHVASRTLIAHSASRSTLFCERAKSTSTSHWCSLLAHAIHLDKCKDYFWLILKFNICVPVLPHVTLLLCRPCTSSQSFVHHRVVHFLQIFG